MKNPTRLKLLLMKGERGWTGQVLDVNVAFEFDYLVNMKPRLMEAISDTLAAYKDVGYSLTDSLPKAPQLFWDMYEKGTPLNAYIDGVVAGILGNDSALDGSFEVDDRDVFVAEKQLCAA